MEKFGCKERVAALAGRQAGRISWGQLRRLGIAEATISQWTAAGYLNRVLPRVYAVGHTAPNRDAALWAAILYAGPGAMLSHATAGHHRGIVDVAPAIIHVTTPRPRVGSLPGRVRVHSRRGHDRELIAGLPVTSIPQTLIDLAASVEPRVLRRALAQLDYRRQLGPGMLAAIEAECGRGIRGSRSLRQALGRHQPKFAHVNGPLEERFLELIQRWGLPLPRINVRVHGILVDAYWPEQRLVVELDGRANHSSPAQLRRDRDNELILRAHGLSVQRYDAAQVHVRAADVRRDLRRALRC